MVQALVEISDRANRVLNVVKAKYGLRTKSEALEKIAEEYERELLEPELRPAYVRRLEKIEKERTIRVSSAGEVRSRSPGGEPDPGPTSPRAALRRTGHRGTAPPRRWQRSGPAR